MALARRYYYNEAPIDLVTGMQIESDEKIIIMHRDHYVGLSTCRSYLDHLLGQAAENVTIDYQTFGMGTVMEKYGNNNGMLYFVWSRRLYAACPGEMGNPCSEKIRVKNLIKKLPKGLQKRYKQKLGVLLKRLKRRSLKKIGLGEDCPNCIDADYYRGIGYPLSRILMEFRDYQDNFDKIRQCESCSHIWCKDCKHSYHGDHEGKLCWELEERAGAEEQANREMITRSCFNCPECGVNIEKNGGCNHMTCQHCRAEFCYLCMTIFPDETEMIRHYEYQCDQFGGPIRHSNNNNVMTEYHEIVPRTHCGKCAYRIRPVDCLADQRCRRCHYYTCFECKQAFPSFSQAKRHHQKSGCAGVYFPTRMYFRGDVPSSMVMGGMFIE